MRVPQLIGVVAATLLSVSVTHARPGSAEAEIARVQAHLDGALDLLAARDLRELSPEARTRRAELVDVLRAYRDAGVFPINRDFPGALVPYFKDAETGTLCAVGFLLAHTGRTDIIDEVVATNNHVRIAELAEHAEFRAWLNAHGLLLHEAARIQPTYGGDGGGNLTPGDPPLVVRTVTPRVLSAGAFLSTSLALAGAFTPRGSESRLMAASGLGVGLATVAIGVFGNFHEPTRREARLSLVAGIASTTVSARLLSRSRQVPEQPSRLSVAPIVGDGGGGLAFRFEF